MTQTLRELGLKDKNKVLELIDSRIGHKMLMSNSGINQAWVDGVMKKDETYSDRTYRLFGLFEDDDLDCFVMYKVLVDNDNFKLYVVSMFMSHKKPKKPSLSKDGYGINSTLVNDFGHAQMRKEGFTDYYTMTPWHPDWKQFEDNPNRPKYYNYENKEIIKAGELTTIPLHKHLVSRTFSVDMVVRKATPNWEVINRSEK